MRVPKKLNIKQIAQKELDDEWAKLFDKHIIVNDNLVFHFAENHQQLYLDEYAKSIMDIATKHGCELKKATFDTDSNIFNAWSWDMELSVIDLEKKCLDKIDGKPIRKSRKKQISNIVKKVETEKPRQSSPDTAQIQSD